ncbi:Albonoursin synthase [Fundidesulfovibrio magnetotacticus]|uniref:Albonoursin synthase n=1 Tax=Fundidesulfovibrio magnetotacticus TaxID=2730080 RepID=A0A6V8LN23_9BACT|nr:nitroreductase family protein [Fundidesulfovibrio magnetotacticus]GFK94053.1 Albonoursin synthase [Fundidesulfovibrio magnetotacticus]
MDALDCLFTRRSIRQFTADPVDPEALNTALEAAMSAPSAGNAQPWHFVLVRERALLDAVPGFHPYAAMSRQAQAGVLVCADPALEKYPGYWPLDCAAAVQNLLLALHAQGLGAVWVGVWPEADRVENFRKLLGVPAQVIPHSWVPVGVPGQPAHRADRFRPERVHENRW